MRWRVEAGSAIYFGFNSRAYAGVMLTTATVPNATYAQFISCAGKLYNTDVRCCVLLDRIAKDNVKELVDFRRKQVKIVQDKLRVSYRLR